jgi:hypothetical protein
VCSIGEIEVDELWWGKFTDSPERLWGRKNAVNAITMEEAMKRRKRRKRCRWRGQKRRGRGGGRKRGKWQVNRSYSKKDAVLDFWKVTPEKISDNGGTN